MLHGKRQVAKREEIRESFFFLQFSRRTAVIHFVDQSRGVLEFRCESSPNPKSVSVKKSLFAKNRTPHHFVIVLVYAAASIPQHFTHTSQINIIHIVGVRSNPFQIKYLSVFKIILLKREKTKRRCQP
jgi:hypothetical protein